MVEWTGRMILSGILIGLIVQEPPNITYMYVILAHKARQLIMIRLAIHRIMMSTQALISAGRSIETVGHGRSEQK